jgi:membrane-bound lytic murein transglycosylase D
LFNWLLSCAKGPGSGLGLLLVLLLSACAHHPKKKSNPTPNGPVAAGAAAAATDAEGEEEADSGDEDDAEAVEADADAEPKEETPAELGDVESASETRLPDEIRADILARSTFPLVENEFVEQWIRYFTGRGREHFKKWQERAPRYLPLITQTMKADGLPEDLVYLAMIESGFNPKARSRAKAVGPWQFIKSTGMRYDLQVDNWIDERRDIEKSTHAAATYLKELHQIFGSWYLAAASYNAGEGKVLRAVRADRSRNFWELARAKKNFRAETRNYVPKIIAAALISKNPAKYGFDDLVYETPIEWEKARVPAGTDLRAVSSVLNVDRDALVLMNSELRRGRTPLTGGAREIKVPVGRSGDVLAAVDKIAAMKFKEPFLKEDGLTRGFAPLRSDGRYRVRRGDTLWTISRNFGVTVDELREANNFSSAKALRPGKWIEIPVDLRRSPRVSKKGRRPTPVFTAAAAASSPLPEVVGGTYTIQSGDTLWDLARRNGTTVAEIKRLNAIRSARDLRAGKVIRVPGQGGKAN